MTGRLRRHFRRVLDDQRGFALVLALGVTVVFSMTVVTVIESAQSNQRSATMSSGRASAYDLAEAGVNNAMSVLRLPTNNALDKYVFCTDSGSLPTLPCKRTDTYSNGKVIWYGTLYQNAAAGTAYWDLFSTGYVRNPYGGADYQKTLRATIPVVPVTTQPLNNPSWNYIFSRNSGSSVALSGCDMTLQNSVNVTSPLYVMDNLWATILDTSPPAVTPPTVNWNDWYLNGSPGPYYPCAAPQPGDPLNPSFLFDNPVGVVSDSDTNKLAYKNDNQGIANLTPSSSYQCRTVNGELSWDYPSKILTVSGTIYLDGSAKVDIGGVVRYKGEATIYTSGTMLVKNTQLCGFSAGATCTFASWDSTKDLLGFVANGNGS